jgi:hypothetical protein
MSGTLRIPVLLIEAVGTPTPHPAFGHLLPVEGRRKRARGHLIFRCVYRVHASIRPPKRREFVNKN